jgi:hypothetical protein
MSNVSYGTIVGDTHPTLNYRVVVGCNFATFDEASAALSLDTLCRVSHNVNPPEAFQVQMIDGAMKCHIAEGATGTVVYRNHIGSLITVTLT